MKTLFFALVTMVGISTFAKDYIVETKNNHEGQSMTFHPIFLEVAVGDSVTFKPTNPGHNSQSFYLPEGASSWEGETGKEITVKFDKEGHYLYECVNHGVMGMVGLIKVGKAQDQEAAKEALQKLKKKMAMKKDRLDAYILK